MADSIAATMSLCTACAGPGPRGATTAELEAGAAAPADGGVHGSLLSRYRGRWANGHDDHDLIEVVSLDWEGRGESAPSATVVARLAQDLDGGSSSGGADPFGSLSDAEGNRLDAKLYEAYLDLPMETGLERIRLGRQQDFGPPELAWFDGVHFQGRAHGESATAFSAFAGVPVHLYESSSQGDAIAGLAVEGRPWSGANARLDWMYFEDETTQGTQEDDLFGATLDQAVSDALSLQAKAVLLDSDPYYARLGGTWVGEDGFYVRAMHYMLFETQRDRSLEVDPFFDSLRFLFPYQQTSLLLARDTERATVEVGADVRRVEGDDDVGVFNREYDRGWMTVTFPEALPGEVTPSVSAERWHGDANEVEGLGLQLTKDLDDDEELTLGTYVSLFKVDIFGVSEREDVRTWFGRWRRRPGIKGLDLDVWYEYEDGEVENYHSLRARVTWRF